MMNPLTTLAAFDTSRLIVGGTLVLFVVVCVLLVLTILIQKPQGGGLSGAFGAGSSGSGQTAFGTKTGDALTWLTIGMFILYLGAAIGMNYTMRPPTAAPSGGTVSPAPSSTTPTTTPAPAPAPAATPPAQTPGTNSEPIKGTTPPVSSTIKVNPPVANPPAATPPAATPPAATPPATTPPAATPPGTAPATTPPATDPATPPKQ